MSVGCPCPCLADKVSMSISRRGTRAPKPRDRIKMHAPEFLACDWGTTHLRAWVLTADRHILRHQTFPYGVSRLSRGEAKQIFSNNIRRTMEAEHLPALLCGMIGSDLGWTPVPYQACPAGLSTLADALFQIEDRPGAWIVPGLRCAGITDAPDVMRGEETQILGWLAEDSSRGSGRLVICHPGTHTKWALIDDGCIVRFITAMTGELFDVLRSHSVLQTDSAAGDENAFD